MKWALGSMILNAFLAVIKILAGWFGHSFALIADGLESTVDIFSSAIIYNGLRVAKEPADINHPYGHGRAETIAAAAGALILMAAAVFICINAAQTLFADRPSPNPKTLIVLLLVIIIKETAFQVLNRVSKKIRSQAIKVEAWHHRSDMYTSLAAGIGIAIAIGTGWSQADSVAAILASLWMGWNGFHLLRPSVDELMESSNDPALIAKIRELCTRCEDVRGVDKVLVRKMGFQLMVDLHLEVDPEESVRVGHEIAHKVKDILRYEIPAIADVLIHVEPYPHHVYDYKSEAAPHREKS